MTEPLLSICIPTRNRAAFLYRTLRSITETPVFQNGNEVEVVVSDNASTDATEEIVKIFTEKYGNKIVYSRNETDIHDENFGKALRLAGGEFLKLNNDTFWFEGNGLERLLSKIKQYKKERPVLCFTNDGIKIEIRNPVAVRPWQHVLEPFSGYMLLGEKLYTEGKKYAEGFNFGPHEDSVLTVADVAQKIVGYYGKGEVVVHKRDDLHEAGLLMLSIRKAARILGWRPVLTAEEAIENSVEWYRRFYAGEEMTDFTLRQIDAYMKRSKEK